MFAFCDAFFCCFRQFWAIPLHTGAENSQSTDPNITLQHSVNILFCLKLPSICAAMPFLLSSAFLDESFVGLLQKLKGHGLECHQHPFVVEIMGKEHSLEEGLVNRPK